MTHCMVDTETFGQKPGCAILSIGAVIFDPFSKEEPREKFYSTIDLTSAVLLGLTVDQKTVEWWQKQNIAAQHELSRNPVNIKAVLGEFQMWCNRNAVDRIWCHGAGFDAPIIEHALKLAELDSPWRYAQIRDTRTVYDLFNIDLIKRERIGVYHNALDDAIFQVKAVQDALQNVRP